MIDTTKDFLPIITEEIFETVVILALQNPKESYLLVEGSTDYAIFSKYIDEEKILFFDKEHTQNSKKTILSTIKKVNEQSNPIQTRLLAIIDRDFDTLQPDIIKIPDNVLYCDYHDLDAQIFFSEAFKHFFRIHLYEPWKLNIESIREKIAEIGIQYGLYKLIFHNMFISIRKLNPNFPEVEDLIKIQTNNLNTHKFCDYLSDVLNTAKYNLYQKKLKKYDRFSSTERNLVPSGHDLIRILCVFILNSVLEIEMLNLTKQERIEFNRNIFHFTRKIENHFRSCYDLNCFQKSDLFMKLIAFEETYNVKFLK
jgi:hypothetical protein